MPKYFKAYEQKDLARFAAWDQISKQPEGLKPNEEVFLTEDFRVTRNCLNPDNEADLLVASSTPEWEAWCRGELGYQVPNWEQESTQVREHLKKEGII